MPSGSPSPAVDLQKLSKLERDGLISTQKHPSLDLLIHNYTPRCQYGKAWDELTLMCRGLITDLSGNIVARPFPKFFNLGEHLGHETSAHEGFTLPTINWKQEFTALKKYDGSLGILYFAGDQAYLATRGSFTSDQAIRGTKIFRAKGYHLYGYPRDLTFLWEILFPENRIVIDYGGKEECVLLDVIDVATGRSIGQEGVVGFGQDVGCPVAETIPATAEMLQECSQTNVPNEEGYVVRFGDGTRLKVKFEEYVRLHRLVTGVSSKSIWESLASGQGVEELLDRVPDEFNAWVKQTVADLQDQFDSTLLYCKSAFDSTRSRLGDAPRKEYAAVFTGLAAYAGRPVVSVLFAMLSGKDPAPIIWKMVKPAHSRPFHQDIDG